MAAGDQFRDPERFLRVRAGCRQRRGPDVGEEHVAHVEDKVFQLPGLREFPKGFFLLPLDLRFGQSVPLFPVDEFIQDTACPVQFLRSFFLDHELPDVVERDRLFLFRRDLKVDDPVIAGGNDGMNGGPEIDHGFHGRFPVLSGDVDLERKGSVFPETA